MLVFFVMIVTAYIVRKLALKSWDWIMCYRRVKIGSSISSIVFRFVLEGYVELFFSALISLSVCTKIDLVATNGSDVLAILLGVVFFVFCCVLPIIVAYVLRRKIHYLDEIDDLEHDCDAKAEDLSRARRECRKFDAQWSVFYHGIFDHKDNLTFMYYYCYTLRRMAFVLLCYYLSHLVAFQLMLNILINMTNLMYLYHTSPWLSRDSNQIEILNELSILLSSYLIMGFSDWQPEPSVKYDIGGMLIVLILLNVTVNLTLIGFKIYKLRRKSLQRKKWIKDYAEAQTKINEKYTIRQ
jgi:hypothetical protein